MYLLYEHHTFRFFDMSGESHVQHGFKMERNDGSGEEAHPLLTSGSIDGQWSIVRDDGSVQRLDWDLRFRRRIEFRLRE